MILNFLLWAGHTALVDCYHCWKRCIAALQKGGGSPGWFWTFLLWAGMQPQLIVINFLIFQAAHCCWKRKVTAMAAKDDFEFFTLSWVHSPSWLLLSLEKHPWQCITALPKGSGSPGWTLNFLLWAGHAAPVDCYCHWKRCMAALQKGGSSPGWFWIFTLSQHAALVDCYQLLDFSSCTLPSEKKSHCDGSPGWYWIFYFELGMQPQLIVIVIGKAPMAVHRLIQKGGSSPGWTLNLYFELDAQPQLIVIIIGKEKTHLWQCISKNLQNFWHKQSNVFSSWILRQNHVYHARY